MVTNLGPVIIFTRQFDESRRFYERALGLVPEREDAERYVEYHVGRGTWALHRSDTDVRGSGAVHLHLMTDSLEHVINQAASVGVHPMAAVEEKPWGTEASFKDPTGIVIDVVNRPSAH